MTQEEETSSHAREHLLAVAERLFSERGYTAVTLKDIAEALNVKQAALYYHVPGGKEDLFMAVISRNFLRHRKGLEQAINESDPHIAARFKALAGWLISQPPLDMSRLARSDLPALSPANAQKLYELGKKSLEEPIHFVISEAYQSGEVRLVDPQIMTTVFLSVMDTVHDMHRYKQLSKEVLAQDMIEVLLDGLRRR